MSVATVSYTFSERLDQRNKVSPAVRERVQAAARRLGYRRNHAARSLRRSKTEVVAVVERPPSSPWSAKLIEELHHAALQRGYSVITMQVGEDDWTHTALRSLREQHVDGAILTPPCCMPVDELTELANNGLALVVFDDDIVPNGFDVVRQGQSAACTRAVTHLIERGHRRIAFYGPSPPVDNDPKFDGYRRALDAHDIAIDDELIFHVADSRPLAFRTTTELLRRDDPPSALFSATDRGALAAIWAAQQSGISVPGDLAVVGVGNTDESDVITPALTSVGSDEFDFTAVVERLFTRVATGDDLTDIEIDQTWGLVVRQST